MARIILSEWYCSLALILSLFYLLSFNSIQCCLVKLVTIQLAAQNNNVDEHTVVDRRFRFQLKWEINVHLIICKIIPFGYINFLPKFNMWMNLVLSSWNMESLEGVEELAISITGWWCLTSLSRASFTYRIGLYYSISPRDTPTFLWSDITYLLQSPLQVGNKT